MPDRFEFTAATENIGERIDKLLSVQLPEMSRSALQKLVTDGCVLVNGNSVNKNYKMKNGDTVTVDIPEPEELKAEPQDIPIDSPSGRQSRWYACKCIDVSLQRKIVLYQWRYPPGYSPQDR